MGWYWVTGYGVASPDGNIYEPAGGGGVKGVCPLFGVGSGRSGTPMDILPGLFCGREGSIPRKSMK